MKTLYISFMKTDKHYNKRLKKRFHLILKLMQIKKNHDRLLKFKPFQFGS